MTVHALLGFDAFGYASQSTGKPFSNAGLTQHPGRPTVSLSIPAAQGCLGVPADERFLVGRGANKRRAMVLHMQGTVSTAAVMSATFPIATPAVWLPNVVGSKLVIGFRVRFGKSDNGSAMTIPNVWVPVFALHGTTIFQWAPNAGTLQVGSVQMVTPLVPVADQEYYIELVINRNTAGGSTCNCELYIDGRKFSPSSGEATIGAPTAGPASYGFYGNMGAGAWSVAIAVSDVYCANLRLGPKMVISRQPSVTIESNWAPSQGTDPLAMITGSNTTDDNKYITSPDGLLPDKYRMDFDLKEGFKAFAAAVYLRGKRDMASTRMVKAAVFNRQSNEELDPSKSVTIDFSQQAWRTDLAWFTDVDTVLTRDNINNMAMSLTATAG